MANSRSLFYERIRLALTTPGLDRGNGTSKSQGTPMPAEENRAALWQRFQKELSSIAGDFCEIASLPELKALLLPLFSAQKRRTLALCQTNLERLIPTLDNVELVDASAIRPEDKKSLLSPIPVALSKASYAIAEIGSIAVLSNEVAETWPLFLSDFVVLLVPQDRIVPDLSQFFRLARPGGNLVLITGPSRTADIEKVLVLGAHGPQKLIVCRLADELWSRIAAE